VFLLKLGKVLDALVFEKTNQCFRFVLVLRDRGGLIVLVAIGPKNSAEELLKGDFFDGLEPEGLFSELSFSFFVKAGSEPEFSQFFFGLPRTLEALPLRSTVPPCGVVY